MAYCDPANYTPSTAERKGIRPASQETGNVHNLTAADAKSRDSRFLNVATYRSCP